MLRDEDIVVEEAVTNSGLLYEHLVRRLPGTICGAFAPGLGWALGGAVGVKLARPERRVVAVCGDGSLLFSVPTSALMMSAALGAPFVTVVLDNGGYRASRLPVYELFPEGASALAADAVGTRFGDAPDYVALANAWSRARRAWWSATPTSNPRSAAPSPRATPGAPPSSTLSCTRTDDLSRAGG